ncbi:MAG: glycosylhydrolase-like jelly roll fold domain-containing protein, partial [Lacipirellulaceae bacterium]
YFSGKATYETELIVDRETLERCSRVDIDLGRVGDLAEVWVNDGTTGVMWRPPMSRDVRPMLRPGRNKLRVVVWNTWHNRLAGDEQFAADFTTGRDKGEELGRGLAAFPDWLLKGGPRPSGDRLTFTSWFYHRRDTPLLPAGLIGPVRLVPYGEVALRPTSVKGVGE